MSVDTAVAPTLGPFYNQRVTVSVEQTTTWSTSTGKETRTFSLVDIHLAETEPAAVLPSQASGRGSA